MAIAAVTVGAFAQPPAQSPYAGLQSRPIKALSAEQIADLKAGLRISLALPAELNGYPGPRHLLDLADQLGLSSSQRNALQSMFDTMKAEAIPIGERLIARRKSRTRWTVRSATGHGRSNGGRRHRRDRRDPGPVAQRPSEVPPRDRLGWPSPLPRNRASSSDCVSGTRPARCCCRICGGSPVRLVSAFARDLRRPWKLLGPGVGTPLRVMEPGARRRWPANPQELPDPRNRPVRKSRPALAQTWTTAYQQ